MLIFIENTPRAYAWGSHDALPELLGTAPTGEPQAELWLGAHPGSPASVAKASPTVQTLIDLIGSDADRYGVDGGPLPFLLKVLAIGAPLSLQVHPDSRQAAAGFAAEEAAGVPLGAPERNYGDPFHKPELLVALGEVTALSGFRSLAAAGRDFRELARVVPADESAALDRIADRIAAVGGGPGAAAEELRGELLSWAFSGDADVALAIRGITRAVQGGADAPDIDQDRITALRGLVAGHPGDPGVLLTLLLHLVKLAPGEAVYLGARQIHAYQSGIAVEIMASSDNVLRAGLTQKHVDIDELRKIVDLSELAEPRFEANLIEPGLVAWEPGVPDFKLMRARVCAPREDNFSADFDGASRESSERLRIEVPYPVVLIVTAGRVRVERPEAEVDEVANVGRGQSLYISRGAAIELSGSGEAFLATVGANWLGRGVS